MNKKFYENNNIIDLNISYIEAKYVTEMTNILSGSDKIKSLNLFSFDTKNVSIMKNILSEINNIIEINILLIEAKNLTDMANLFSVSDKKNKLKLFTFVTKNVSKKNNKIFEINNIIVSNLSSYEPIYNTDMTNMFYFGSDINLNLNIYSFDTNKITKFDNIYFEILN